MREDGLPDRIPQSFSTPADIVRNMSVCMDLFFFCSTCLIAREVHQTCRKTGHISHRVKGPFKVPPHTFALFYFRPNPPRGQMLSALRYSRWHQPYMPYLWPCSG